MPRRSSARSRCSRSMAEGARPAQRRARRGDRPIPGLPRRRRRRHGQLDRGVPAAADDAVPGTILRAQCVAQEHARTADGLIEFAPIERLHAPVQPASSTWSSTASSTSPRSVRGRCRWGPFERCGSDSTSDLPVLRGLGVPGPSRGPARASATARRSPACTADSPTAGDRRRPIDEDDLARDRATPSATGSTCTPTLLPAGSIEPMARLREDAAAYSAAYDAAIAQVEAFERSRYWQLTAPLRWVTGRRGRSISLLKAQRCALFAHASAPATSCQLACSR